jgi:predicted nucleotidyltransferase
LTGRYPVVSDAPAAGARTTDSSGATIPAMRDTTAVRGALASLAQAQEGLTLLMLFGSRARGDAHEGSDWDLGYLAASGFDDAALLGHIVEVLGSERVDLVDLARASGLLRFRAARDGVLIHETEPGAGDRFRIEAARFWHDVEPVLLPAYERFLERVGR